MTRVFLYGTLRDPELRHVVIGRDIPCEPANLRGFALRSADAGDWPALAQARSAMAEGVLTCSLDAGALSRLDWYERTFGYRPHAVEVGGVPAQIYRSDDREVGPADWDFAAWQHAWGPVTRHAAAEAMEHHPARDPDWIALRWPQIRQRAASAVRAADAMRPMDLRSGLAARDVEIVAMRRPYTDYFSLVEQDVRFRRHDGGSSAAVTRAALVAGDAVTVLPYDPAADTVLLIEQFRFGPWARGDRRPWTLEPIAGRIDPGEDAAAAGRREAREEAGIEIADLERVAAYYPTTGAMSEYVFSFVGLCRLGDRGGTIAGEAAEDEDILSHVIPFGRLLDLVQSGEAENAPLILSALWLAANRDRLRDR